MTYEYAYDFKKAKQTDLVELCMRLDIQVNDFMYPPMAQCPFHGDTDKPNLALYQTPSGRYKEPHYYCFRCKTHGNAIDLVARSKGIAPWEAAKFILGEKHAPGKPNGSQRNTRQAAQTSTQTERDFTSAAKLAHERLLSGSGSKARAYLAERGLLDVAIDYKLGLWWADESRWSNRLVIPYPDRIGASGRSLGAGYLQPKDDQGSQAKTIEIPAAGIAEGFRVTHLKGRDLSGLSLTKYLASRGASTVPYLRDTAIELSCRHKILLVCEGELDVLTVKLAMGYDFPVMGLPGATNHREDHFPELPPVDAFVMLDADKAGEEEGDKVRRMLLSKGCISARTLSPERIRAKADLNDMLVHMGKDHLASWLIDRLRT